MRVTLLDPRDSLEGDYKERLCIYAARRTRTTKSREDLWKEVHGYSDLKMRKFLTSVIHQEWAADIMEMVHLVYDWEEVPLWLIVELLRHRLVAREFSLEQLSQRAIGSSKLKVEVSGSLKVQELVDTYLRDLEGGLKEEAIHPEDLREAYPQGVLVNLVIAGNLRSFHHFFFMRSSPLFGGKGGAHYKFMELADQMQAQAKEVLPNLMSSILKA